MFKYLIQQESKRILPAVYCGSNCGATFRANALKFSFAYSTDCIHRRCTQTERERDNQDKSREREWWSIPAHNRSTEKNDLTSVGSTTLTPADWCAFISDATHTTHTDHKGWCKRRQPMGDFASGLSAAHPWTSGWLRRLLWPPQHQADRCSLRQRKSCYCCKLSPSNPLFCVQASCQCPDTNERGRSVREHRCGGGGREGGKMDCSPRCRCEWYKQVEEKRGAEKHRTLGW